MERQLIGKGYYAVDADRATPTPASEGIRTAFREAFSIPSSEIHIVTGKAAQVRQYGFLKSQETIAK